LDDMQLQIKEVDYKYSMLAKWIMGLDFTNPGDTHQRVSDDATTIPHVWIFECSSY
jgi:hypothetical protein